MSVATYSQPMLSVGLVKKMDDTSKKRVAVTTDLDDALPPPKRQATMTNGTGHEDKADAPKFGTINTPWQTDLDTLQKDFIFRQMREYKREKTQLEVQVAELEKKSGYHDDHLRIIDAWWSQLIDEVKVVVNDHSSAQKFSDDPTSITSALQFEDSAKFRAHLNTRSDCIKETISTLYSKLPAASSEVRELQNRVNTLLAEEKVHIAELHRVTSEKDQLADRLENASYRYLLAERKLDRTKSQAVASLEMQGQVQSQPMRSETSDSKTNGEIANGISDGNGVASEEAERDRLEATAVATKAKEQLSKLEEDNAKLTREVTLLKSRLDSLSDEDYANTELFKIAKSQLEDSYNKLNDLESTHIQLREEAKKAQAERTSYRLKLDEESRAAVSEAESQLARADADLQRIRAARDDLAAEKAILESSQADRQLSTDQTKALAKARQDRISALESEVERLKIQCGEVKVNAADEELELDSVEDLRAKVASLKKEYSLLSNELPSMEGAWRKAQSLASNRIAQVAQWEEQIGRLNAEKAKADQKYFGAMKTKEAQEGELRSLRKQNKASSGIISSLKETEAKIRELCTNLDKQLAEDRANMATMSREQHFLDQKAIQATIAEAGLQSQVAKLKESLSEKDAILSSAEHTRREVEQEVEALKIKLEASRKKSEEWRSKAKLSSSDELNNLRRVAYCQCGKNLKDTVISQCGHILCKSCIDDRVTARMRKCPVCMKSFGINDFYSVHLV